MGWLWKYMSMMGWWGWWKSRLIFHSHRLNVFEMKCLNVLVRKRKSVNVCVHTQCPTPQHHQMMRLEDFLSVSDVYDNPVTLLEFFNPSQLLLVLVTAPNIFSCLFLNHLHILLLFCRFLLAFYYFTRLLLLLLIIFSTSE